MSQGNYILVNGSFLPAADFGISLDESDGFLFSVKIRAVRSAFPFFAESLKMIKFHFMLFNQTFPELTENEGAELKRQMERTLTKNKQFLGALLTIRFWVSEQKVSYSIQSEKLESINYQLNTNGLYVAVFQEIKKTAGSLSNFATGSELYWKLAEIHLKSSSFDQFMILNNKDLIVEAIRSNVYLLKRNSVFGASMQQGAYADITKPLMLTIFEQLKLSYSENDGITVQNLLDADEILLVDAITGIQWVVGFEGKRYFNNAIRKINDLFVRSLTN
ncbi:MAG TPA: hypothetical protein DHV48_06455 [Prolixibacteraceae bacterium]|nr:hypothetical protein [Prolixibacteraceae bacterium]